jgi:hypothetical protein
MTKERSCKGACFAGRTEWILMKYKLAGCRIDESSNETYWEHAGRETEVQTKYAVKAQEDAKERLICRK